MDVNESLFYQINLGLLLKRLTACAAKWFLEEGCLSDEAILPATGKSAKELAFDTVTKFIEGNIKWEQHSSDSLDRELFLLLKRVMRNDFLDLVKTGREYKRVAVLDIFQEEEDRHGVYEDKLYLENLPDSSQDGFNSMEAASVASRVYPLLKDEPELIAYVDAVLRTGCLKREDIAVALKISAQEATNRQRRLRLKLAAWRQSIDAD